MTNAVAAGEGRIVGGQVEEAGVASRPGPRAAASGGPAAERLDQLVEDGQRARGGAGSPRRARRWAEAMDTARPSLRRALRYSTSTPPAPRETTGPNSRELRTPSRSSVPKPNFSKSTFSQIRTPRRSRPRPPASGASASAGLCSASQARKRPGTSAAMALRPALTAAGVGLDEGDAADVGLVVDERRDDLEDDLGRVEAGQVLAAATVPAPAGRRGGGASARRPRPEHRVDLVLEEERSGRPSRPRRRSGRWP